MSPGSQRCTTGSIAAHTARNRPAELGLGQAARSDVEAGAQQGRILETDSVAELVLAGIRHNRLYIHTHKEADPLVARRAERIGAAFANAL